MGEECTGSGMGDQCQEISHAKIWEWIGRLLGECAKGFAWGLGFGGGLAIILRLFGASS